MPNMRMDKNPMPSQDPNVRNKNFEEVALGYTEEQAVDEAERCLNCKNHPCMEGCPVQISIPEFIQKNLVTAVGSVSHDHVLCKPCHIVNCLFPVLRCVLFSNLLGGYH